MESFSHHSRDLVNIHDQITVLDHRESHSEDVRLLKCTSADHFLGHLAGDGHQRNGIHISVSNTGHEISRPGSGGSHTDASASGCSSIAAGGKHAPLFV